MIFQLVEVAKEFVETRHAVKAKLVPSLEEEEEGDVAELAYKMEGTEEPEDFDHQPLISAVR